jgi:basic membrane lipoprotein Med (substrate-binding protein (PBP1-ABC) superfamily)/DNA-binding SARP family transcriptional activator
MTARRLEFRILGPLDVRVDGVAVSVGGPKQRALLALLLLHANQVVSRDRLIEELVPDRAGRAAADVLNVQMSRLRKALEAADAAGPRLVARPPGYLLRIEPGELDVERFERLLAEGRAARERNDLPSAAELIREALSLWRGRPLADLEYEPFVRAEVERLEELRLTAVEDRFDVELALGRHAELVPELELLVHEHPSRERLLGQLMVSLYRSGRQSEALAAYAAARQQLAEELGLEPSRSLRDLEQSILRQDPALDRPSPPPHTPETPAEASARPRRLTPIGIAATLVAIAAIATLLVTATSGQGRPRPSATARRIALVEASQRNLTSTNGVTVDPINGLHTAAQQLGVQTKVFYGGEQPSGLVRTIAAAARRYNLVIVGSTPWVDAVSKVTRSFPNTRFLVSDSVHDPAASFAGQRNVTGMNFDDRQNGYLGGYLAGLMAHGRQAVSAVGGVPLQPVRDLIAGFTAGARHARPGIRVLVNYTQNFTDESLCEAAASKQINSGSAVVFDVAGLCGFGALQAAQTRGVWGLGVDDNLSYLGPRILASVVKQYANATLIGVRLFASGQLPRAQDLQFDFANQGIGLIGISNAVPLEVRAKVARLAAKLTAQDQAGGGR